MSAGRTERHFVEADDGSYVTSARGLDVLHDPLLNKGTAFTEKERAELGLERYRSRVPTFNDDMQGTGAIVLAATLVAIRITGVPMRDQRIVIFGAGTAGIGIADQLYDAMVRDGLDRATARRRIWAIDKQGLPTDDLPDLRDFQVPYARPASEAAGWSGTGLYEVVQHVRPTVLVGTSTAHGAFTEEVVHAMAASVERPVIFPISNPTERMEAMPGDLIRWTDGRALIATGVPVDPIT